MNKPGVLTERKSGHISQDGKKNRRKYAYACIAAAVLILAGSCIAVLLKNAKPHPAVGADMPISTQVPAASTEQAVEDDPGQYGRLMPAVPPYITCGNRLYFHVADMSSGLMLSELKEEAYGFAGDPAVYELLSEAGELSDRIYIRNPQGDEEDLPTYWVFDYVCDTCLEYRGRTICGRYGLTADDPFYPGELLMQGGVEVYECLTDGNEPAEGLYILKVNADISDILDAGPTGTEEAGSWREMKQVYEAELTDEWAILLLASPEW